MNLEMIDFYLCNDFHYNGNITIEEIVGSSLSPSQVYHKTTRILKTSPNKRYKGFWPNVVGVKLLFYSRSILNKRQFNSMEPR